MVTTEYNEKLAVHLPYRHIEASKFRNLQSPVVSTFNDLTGSSLEKSNVLSKLLDNLQ